MNVPMLADFALRLATGLAFLLLLTSSRLVPPAFFRTHCLVILGLLVLAALDGSRTGMARPWIIALVALGVLAYGAAVAWGIGLPRLGYPLSGLIALVGSTLLLALARNDSAGMWALNGLGAVASAVLMGATLTAMLLGHYYLNSPAMSIQPLERFVLCMGGSLGLRAALAAVGLGVFLATRGTSLSGDATVSPLFLAVRWGMGIVGPAIAAVLAWNTVKIRSTQSATGILYIGMTLVLFGELTALVLSREVGVLF